MKQFFKKNYNWLIPMIAALLIGISQMVVQVYTNEIKTIMPAILTTILYVLMILCAMIAIIFYAKNIIAEFKADVLGCNNQINYLSAKLNLYDIIYNKKRFHNNADPFLIYQKDINILSNFYGEDIVKDILIEMENLFVIQKGQNRNNNVYL